MLISPQKSHRQPCPRNGALCAFGLEDGNLSVSGALATGSDIARKLRLRPSSVYRVSSGEISALLLMVSGDRLNHVHRTTSAVLPNSDVALHDGALSRLSPGGSFFLDMGWIRKARGGP